MPLVEEQTWDLESVLPGGIEGAAFNMAFEAAHDALERLVAQADALGHPDEDPAWLRVIPAMAELENELHQLASFVSCHSSADTSASEAALAEARLAQIAARSVRAWTTPRDWLTRCDAATFERLRAHPEMAEVQVLLDQVRSRAPLTLPRGEQTLFDDLADDAFHGWGHLYRRLSGSLRIDVDGEALSISQARNRMESDDAALRRRIHEATDRAWQTVEEPCANALSRIIGVRRALHARLGIDELAVPLVEQRIKRETLHALREACHGSRPLIWRYLRAKAQLLGQPRLDYCDLLAPVGEADLRVDWSAAQDLVVHQVETFSKEMADFFRLALQRRWVEAEDRPAKRAGAFCASFPTTGESRVFMTFGGGPNSVRTLAHELGHAYHNHVLRDVPRGQRAMTSCLAETASTFAETVVRQAMLKRAPDTETRLALLDRELNDATVFLAQLMVRFDLERALFPLRARGPLRADELTATVQQIQREWFGPALGQLDDRMWASRLHFYLTRAPFYNFPYTFGYLFSSMVHRRATAEGNGWARTYRRLLRDTRQGPAEELARHYLGVDLTGIDAWLAPIQALEPLVLEFELAVARATAAA